MDSDGNTTEEVSQTLEMPDSTKSGTTWEKNFGFISMGFADAFYVEDGTVRIASLLTPLKNEAGDEVVMALRKPFNPDLDEVYCFELKHTYFKGTPP